METNHQLDKSFEDLTKEEKLFILALYINYPIPQDFEQIHKTIARYGWEKLNEEEVNQLRIDLVKARLN
jgi:hypothetical protein